ncbi:baculoviral IAP repeat-containing protein 2-like [Ylistrum balloti]|uniref:baculoviral IAP repeat-containing protein 2-like n=1 Tax=Ylistrum balloti TaxID=509963 RepID=UPI0029057E2B|nr:baculoviral IAP repeat-containing protein 2-like [Ylistrum balloti]
MSYGRNDTKNIDETADTEKSEECYEASFRIKEERNRSDTQTLETANDISGNFISSSISTKDATSNKTKQESQNDEARMNEMSLNLSFVLGSDVKKECTKSNRALDSTHGTCGQESNDITMNLHTNKKIKTRNRNISLRARPKIRKSDIDAFCVRNYLMGNTLMKNFSLVPALRASISFTQYFPNLQIIAFPLHGILRIEELTSNRLPNMDDEVRSHTAIRGSDLLENRITEAPISALNVISLCFTECMLYEWGRLKSFSTFPMDCPIWPIKLAKYGFYYSGEVDKVICFSCNVSHSNWQIGDSVYAVHYRISKRCRFMKGENVGNVPIHGPESSTDRRAGGGDDLVVDRVEETAITSILATPETVTSIFLGSQACNTPKNVMNELESSQRSHLSSEMEAIKRGHDSMPAHPVTETATSSVDDSFPQAGTASTHDSLFASTHVNTSTTSGLQKKEGASNDQKQGSAIPNSAVSTSMQATFQVHIEPPCNQERSGQTVDQQRSLNQQQPTTLAERLQHRYQEQQPHGQPEQEGRQSGQVIANGAAMNLNNLGVTKARPRYPNYSALEMRSGTFNGFPNHLDQTPLEMGRAGFFYAGYEDYVRCFFCGGGLRNWEPGDDPWVEHARWFPRCTFVKLNKGQTFINLVLQRHRELTLPNEYINTRQSGTGQNATPQTATMQTVSQSSTDTTSNATMQSSTAPTSNQAAVRADHQVTERAGPVELTASSLLEKIFNFGDEILTDTSNQTQAGSTNEQVPHHEARSSSPQSSDTSVVENKAAGPNEGKMSENLVPRNRLRGGNLANQYTEEDLTSLREENSQLRQQMKCKICMECVVSIAFLPCGHICCCVECASAVVKCPICRQIIRGSVKTYLS